MTVLETQGLAARHAARALAVAGTARKNAALEAAARTIEAREAAIRAKSSRRSMDSRWPPSPIPSGR